MGDKHRIPIDYAKPDLALRANWPAGVSLLCALVFPLAYAVMPSALSSYPAGLFISFQLWMISGLAAVIFGLIGLIRSNRLKVGGWRIAVAGILFGILNAGAVPALRQYRTKRDHRLNGLGHSFIRCQINMKSIGQGIMLYANDHQGRFPDRLEDLIIAEEIEPERFVCPLSNDVPAAGTTTQAIAANLSAGGHLSYVYLGKGMKVQPLPDPKVVLLYENLSNHVPEFDEFWFLFADGHCDRFPRPQAEKMIEQLKAGVNPPGR